MSSDLDVVSYRPGAEDFAWVFGGVPAVQRGPTLHRARAVHRGLLRRAGARR